MQEEKSVEAKQQKIGSKSSEAKKRLKKITFGFFDAKRISISGSLKIQEAKLKKSMMSSDYDNGSI